jgi:hypothetical protein
MGDAQVTAAEANLNFGVREGAICHSWCPLPPNTRPPPSLCMSTAAALAADALVG